MSEAEPVASEAVVSETEQPSEVINSTEDESAADLEEVEQMSDFDASSPDEATPEVVEPIPAIDLSEQTESVIETVDVAEIESIEDDLSDDEALMDDEVDASVENELDRIESAEIEDGVESEIEMSIEVEEDSFERIVQPAAPVELIVATVVEHELELTEDDEAHADFAPDEPEQEARAEAETEVEEDGGGDEEAEVEEEVEPMVLRAVVNGHMNADYAHSQGPDLELVEPLPTAEPVPLHSIDLDAAPNAEDDPGTDLQDVDAGDLDTAQLDTEESPLDEDLTEDEDPVDDVSAEGAMIDEDDTVAVPDEIADEIVTAESAVVGLISIDDANEDGQTEGLSAENGVAGATAEGDLFPDDPAVMESAATVADDDSIEPGEDGQSIESGEFAEDLPEDEQPQPVENHIDENDLAENDLDKDDQAGDVQDDELVEQAEDEFMDDDEPLVVSSLAVVPVFSVPGPDSESEQDVDDDANTVPDLHLVTDDELDAEDLDSTPLDEPDHGEELTGPERETDVAGSLEVPFGDAIASEEEAIALDQVETDLDDVDIDLRGATGDEPGSGDRWQRVEATDDLADESKNADQLDEPDVFAARVAETDGLAEQTDEVDDIDLLAGQAVDADEDDGSDELAGQADGSDSLAEVDEPSEPVMPSLEDLRAMAADLDEVDAILGRLDTDEDALFADMAAASATEQSLEFAPAE